MSAGVQRVDSHTRTDICHCSDHDHIERFLVNHRFIVCVKCRTRFYALLVKTSRAAASACSISTSQSATKLASGLQRHCLHKRHVQSHHSQPHRCAVNEICPSSFFPLFGYSCEFSVSGSYGSLTFSTPNSSSRAAIFSRLGHPFSIIALL